MLYALQKHILQMKKPPAGGFVMLRIISCCFSDLFMLQNCFGIPQGLPEKSV